MAKRTNFRLIVTVVLVVLIGAGSAWADLTDGLVAHWKLDGDANDSAGNNHGTIHDAIPTTGQIGNALEFDGDGDYVDFGDIDEFEFGDKAFSISAWFYTNGSYVENERAIITKYNYANLGRQWRLLDNSTGYIHFYTSPDGSTHETLSSQNDGYHNQWVHVVGVRNGSMKYLYINGILDNTGATQGVVTGKSSKVYVGCWESPGGKGRFFNGFIDDIRIYNRALSAEEVEELAHGELLGLEITGPDEVAENSQTQYKTSELPDIQCGVVKQDVTRR